MREETKQQLSQSIQNFRLPRYHEIPHMGLYLEQVSVYIGDALAPLGEFTLTSSMIGNYVKKGLIAPPARKMYRREQIAYLFFIAISRSVLSLDAIAAFIKLQKKTYDITTAYNYFVEELENLLMYTFEVKAQPEEIGVDHTDEKRLLYTCILSAVRKIYLEKCLEAVSKEDDDCQVSNETHAL